MRVLITADWHIGVRGDSEIYHKIFEDWIEQFLIPVIKTEKIEKLFIIGDFFDNRSAVNIKSENVALLAISELVKIVDVTMIVGNHDMYFKNIREINSLNKFNKSLTVIKEPTELRIDNRDFFLVPWIINDEEAKKVFNVKSDICLGHFPFNGYEMVRGIKENKGYSLEDLKNKHIKIFSGHFHLRNDVYVGNPFQMSWADTEDDKGVYILDTKTLDVKFIQNNISPIYKKIYLTQLKNKTVSVDVAKGNFIKLILDDTYSEKLLEKLQEVILSKKPLSFTIDGINQEDINTDIEVNDLTNPIESLIVWLNNIEIKKGVNRERLLEKINSLYNNSLQ